MARTVAGKKRRKAKAKKRTAAAVPKTNGKLVRVSNQRTTLKSRLSNEIYGRRNISSCTAWLPLSFLFSSKHR